MTDPEARFQDIFRQVFDDDEIVVTRQTSAADVDGWDSLMHINLIIAVEREFGIRFATAEISGMKESGRNVGDFLDLVEGKLNGR